MALRLAAWPGGLTVYDVAPAPLAELGTAGATVATSVAEVAAASDVVSVMVRDDDQVREVMKELLPAASPGTTVAIHSTVSPDLPGELAAEAAAHGVRVVDAPVSGGAMGAHDGTLAILVGGEDEAFAACAEPFALIGSHVVHCGPAGSGTAAKLARNLLHFVAFTAAGEAQRLAEAAGIDLVELGRVVRHTDAITGGPGAIMHRSTTAPVAPDDGWFAILEHVRAAGGEGPRPRHRAGRGSRRRRTHGALRARPPRPCPRAAPGGLMTDERRQRGLDKMAEVYGFDFQDGPGDFFGYTADHLFADIWSRPGLDTAQRRLLLIGMLAAQGADDVNSIQLEAAYTRGELDAAALREIVVFLAHYAGWPVAAKLNMVVEGVISKHSTGG